MMRCLLAVLCLMNCNVWASELQGVVTNEKNAPVAGATVVLAVAPTVNVLPDNIWNIPGASWGKPVLTDQSGAFIITDLPESGRLFLIVAAEGYQPLQVERTNWKGPVKTKFKLKRIPSKLADAKHQLRRQVVDSEGKPVWGAVVRVWGQELGGQWWYESAQGVDPVTVTDQKGEFVLTSQNPETLMCLRVTASDFAQVMYPTETVGSEPTDMRLSAGCRVSGRVVRDGKPVADVVVSLGQTRAVEETKSLEAIDTKTDAAGKFVFEHAPPNAKMLLLSPLELGPKQGYVAAVKVDVKGDGASVDLGDQELHPGITVAGQLVLAGGGSVPSGMVYLQRYDAREEWVGKVDRDGRFKFEGVPEETFTLGERVAGNYVMSEKNVSRSPMDQYALVGKVDSEVKELKILLVKEGTKETQAAAQFQDVMKTTLQGVMKEE